MGRQIPIDRQKRIILLNWLKQGSIDNAEYSSLLDVEQKRTREEIIADLDRLTISNGLETCRRCQRLNLCELRTGTD